MQTVKYHKAKRVYPSSRGLHLEFETYQDALAFYEDGVSRGLSYQIEDNTIIKPFKKKPTSVMR